MNLFFPVLHVARTAWGDDWPLTVERGILQLRSGRHVVFLVGGKVYAVNGLAKAEKRLLSSRPRYLPIDEIWADDPRWPGLKKSLTRLIEAGLALRKSD